MEKSLSFNKTKENYSSLDGLRAYAAIGIVIMHVQLNIVIKPSVNIITGYLIPWFTNFTLLFMIISAFSMCCGYYEIVRTGAITPARFYSKRFRRAWPFFAMMVLLAFVIEPSWSTFCQLYANLTMCFNLLPDPSIEVIGVGWFLGIVFTFYMLFPFFTFLLETRKRGWLVLILSLFFVYIAIDYFNNGYGFNRRNIINSAPFFITGGIIFLYRNSIKQLCGKNRFVVLTICLILIIARFTVCISSLYVLPDLLIFSSLLIYAIGSHDVVLNNRIVRYLSSISMEIYLCHMMFYRIVSMLRMERFIYQRDILYVLTVSMTLVGAICFSHIVKYYVFPFLGRKIAVLKS